ncbi:uncharacterized protein VTP21DRAFT_11189 [Calcarisporiella thermophila]|uniref:uncharacterized protein n=1 Tax=Calcarisporiella thermophila TaxID=911321 RepID=UPI00374229D2
MNIVHFEGTPQSTPAKLPKMATFYPIHNKKNRKQRSCKLFPCDYDDCTRVFTRSEHLERHLRSPLIEFSRPKRKHTGEKPYSCIVPNCPRTFSRFDNMLQHTTTHHRNRKQSISAPTPLIINSSPSAITERRAQPSLRVSPSLHVSQLLSLPPTERHLPTPVVSNYH